MLLQLEPQKIDYLLTFPINNWRPLPLFTWDILQSIPVSSLGAFVEAIQFNVLFARFSSFHSLLPDESLSVHGLLIILLLAQIRSAIF